MTTDRIPQIVDAFAAQIRAEITRQAIEALNAMSRDAKSTSDMPQVRAKISRHAKGGRRDLRSIEQLQTRLLAFVIRNPNLRMEQINQALGTTTKDLFVPIRKLIAAKRVKAAGQRRGTTYAATKTATE